MRLRGIPVFFAFVFALGALMLVPALSAAVGGDWRAARLFLYAGAFVMAAAAILGTAARKRLEDDAHARAELLTLLGVFSAAPVFAAAPIALIVPWLGWSGALFEAVSCLTTTGATLLDRPEAHPDALHLWRAMLGWIGGLAAVTAAVAILVPRELIDLPGAASARPASERVGRVLALGPGGARTLRALRSVAPLYAGFTAALALVLSALGVGGLAAASHAMGVISTSGISPLPGGMAGQGNLAAEAAMAVFLVLAVSRLTYGRRGAAPGPGAARDWSRGRRDPEVRLLAIAVGVATVWLFLHGVWVGPGFELLERPIDSLHALWGSFFTSLSFLATAGYVSSDWAAAAAWTRVEAPALMLMGLATLGGGVATTAGGVKLFRAYALYRHGGAELARLPHPSMVDTARTSGGRLSRPAIVHAWVYVMLYMVAGGVTLLALTLTGLGFDSALAGAVAAMSNTGPLFPLASGETYAGLSEAARWAMMAAMILGRIEVLAAVALVNPDYWRP